MKIAVVLGTRPEIVKMAPVIRALERRQIDHFVLHTGQHYSYNLDRAFFEQLNLSDAKYNLEVGSRSHAEQTAHMLIGIERILNEEKPSVVLAEGDTNSVLAGALAAAKLHIKVGHVEAGLRSYDRSMPEEINRVLADHASDFLFAPTEKAKVILLGEGIPESKISITGNTIVDAVLQNLEIARGQSNSNPTVETERGTLRLEPQQYLLVTIHRQENVDNMERFASILEGIGRVADKLGLPAVYPIHPRSRKMMKKLGLEYGPIDLVEPMDFISFVQAESGARIILTDSGGVQEESCILGVPCITLRDNTERPETVDVGANIIAGVQPDNILRSAETMLSNPTTWQQPFGDGKAGQRIVDIIMDAKI